MDLDNLTVEEVVKTFQKTTIVLKQNWTIYQAEANEKSVYVLVRPEKETMAMIRASFSLQELIGLAEHMKPTQPAADAIKGTREHSCSGHQALTVQFVDGNGKTAFAVYQPRDVFVLVCATETDAVALAVHMLRYAVALQEDEGKPAPLAPTEAMGM